MHIFSYASCLHIMCFKYSISYMYMYGIFITSGKATQLMDAWYHILNCSWLDQCSCHFPGRPRCEVRQNVMYKFASVQRHCFHYYLCMHVSCVSSVLLSFQSFCYHTQALGMEGNEDTRTSDEWPLYILLVLSG